MLADERSTLLTDFPLKLEYLTPTLNDLDEPSRTVFRTAGGYVHYIDALLPQQIDQLQKTYEEILARGDDRTISEYLYGFDANSNAPHWVALRDLLSIFDLLGNRQIAPFDSGRLKVGQPPDETFDWSLVPERFRYLSAAAEKHGHIGYETEDQEAYLKTLSPADLNELKALGTLLDKDRKDFQDWLGSTLVQDFRLMSLGHPAFAAKRGSKESSHLSVLRSLLLTGGFMTPAPKRSPEELQELRERLNELGGQNGSKG